MDAPVIRDLLTRPWKHGEAVNLRDVRVTGMLDLTGLALCGVDFSGAVFEGEVTARGARFDGLAWFKGAHFAAAADFSGAMFVSDARFDAANFAAKARFSGAEFRGIADFAQAAFHDAADFRALTCYGNADFARIRAQGRTSFAGSEFLGGFWADKAALPADADLRDTQVHGRLWLRGARRGNAALAERDFGLSFGYCWT